MRDVLAGLPEPSAASKQLEAHPVLRLPLMVLLPAGHPLAAQADAGRPEKAIPLSKLAGEVFLRFSAEQNPSVRPGDLKPWGFQLATNKVISVAAARAIFTRGD